MVVQSEYVRDVMVPTIDTISPADSVMVARRRFDSQTERSMIVADGHHPVGIIQWRAIMDQNTIPGEAPVQDFMVQEFPLLKPDTPLTQAIESLGSVDIDRIPVVNEDGDLVGVVPRGSLAHAEQVTQAAPAERTEPWGDQPPQAFSGPGQEAVSTPAAAAGPMLAEGMNVVGVNGDKLGSVSEVLADPMGRATHFLVQHGLLRKKHKRVPVDNVVSADGDTVTVSMTSTEFGFLPDIEDQEG